MKIAIMQPYFFPYIGYWQLISAVDTFVILDDVNYINKGFIDRNIIRDKKELIRIKIILKKASQNKLILDHELCDNTNWKKKLLRTIMLSYSNSPYFGKVFPVIKNIIEHNEKNLSKYLYYQIKTICEYLDIKTTIIKTSSIYNTENKKGQDKILTICKKAEASIYINSIGGRNLYNHEYFKKNRVSLQFIYPLQSIYRHNKYGEYVYNLSIIDVIMHNSAKQIKEYLKKYVLV